MRELQKAIGKSSNSAPGKDGVWNEMLKHLNEGSLKIPLKLYNSVWGTGKLPIEMKHVVAVPAWKSGKLQKRPDKYRPIALTSCMGKAMARMVNEQLTTYLGKKGLVDNVQTGFRTGRSTVDHILRAGLHLGEGVNLRYTTSKYLSSTYLIVLTAAS